MNEGAVPGDFGESSGAAAEPAAMREIVNRALRGTGASPGHLAEMRKTREEHEAIEIQSAGAKLWSKTFDEGPNIIFDAPEGFGEFAQRAVSESAGDAVGPDEG